MLPTNAALADRNGVLRMGSFGNNLGDSMTSLLKTDLTEGKIDVLSLTWKTWLDFSKTEAPTFIKMDIEGGEFPLLPTIK